MYKRLPGESIDEFTRRRYMAEVEHLRTFEIDKPTWDQLPPGLRAAWTESTKQQEAVHAQG
jgi:hypothetical protein